MMERQTHATSSRALVAQSAQEARDWLMPFAETEAPRFSLLKAMLYGTLIDVGIVIQTRPLCGVGGGWYSYIVRSGGSEQIRFLLAVAQFDQNGNGTIDDDEWLAYEGLADVLVSDAFTFSGNLSLVAALMLSLTHLITMGRPVPFMLSAATEDYLGVADSQWLLWTAYAANAVSECCAFFTLCIAVITRSCITNVLPSRESKIAMLRMTNALGLQAVGMLLTLWSFFVASAFGVLVASPTIGLMAAIMYARTRDAHTRPFASKPPRLSGS